jgi:hypothetical protein
MRADEFSVWYHAYMAGIQARGSSSQEIDAVITDAVTVASVALEKYKKVDIDTDKNKMMEKALQDTVNKISEKLSSIKG